VTKPPRRTLRIGISACFFHEDDKRPIFKGKTLLYSVEPLLNWVLAQGALPYMVPRPSSSSRLSLEQIATDLDGLILQGGSDVAPETYGEKPLKPEWAGDAARDKYEIELLKMFMAQGKPVLGVCRGAQLLNVAMGGTLYQDIQTQIPQALNHRNWDIYDQNFHSIDITPGSKLAQCLASQKARTVNSIHHQAVKQLGKGVVIDAMAPDGVIEAISLSSAPFVVAIQWHPEFQDPHASETLISSQGLLGEFLYQASN
jgi:putative glutamine amidotransferase